MIRRGKVVFALIALAFCAVVVALWLHAGTLYDQQIRGLQASLGTTEEPLTFMARAIKPGMTRGEVREYVRGYAWLETDPPGLFSPGGIDVFNYQFGLFVGARWGGVYGAIHVRYDLEGRVLGAGADLN